MFDSLKKHHIGIIITENQMEQIKSIYNKEFITDTIQETRVLFLKEPSKSFLLEYIVQEGRAKNLQLGFGHICYSVENKKRLLYKCVPDDIHLPAFLVPYDVKIGFWA